MNKLFRSAIIVAAIIIVASPSSRLHASPKPKPGTDAFVDPIVPFQQQVRALLVKEDFKALDRMEDELFRSRARFKGGEWKLYRFFGAISQPGAGRADLSDRSSAGDFSNGETNTVTSDGWRLFKDRLAWAESILTSSTAAQSDPQWYCNMIDVGRGLGWDRGRIDATFDGGAEGQVVYGDIAWFIGSQYRSAQLLIQTNVSWERVQLGFIARQRVYGLGQRDLNEFAWMAGAAGDRGAARDVIPQIRGAWDPLVWRDAFAYESFRRWSAEAE